MLKFCLILSLHIAVCRGDGSLILKFCISIYHLQKWAVGGGGRHAGWTGGCQRCGSGPGQLGCLHLLLVLRAGVHSRPSVNIGTPPPAGAEGAPPQPSWTSVRPNISLNSKSPKSQNHGHLTTKAIPRSPSVHVTFNINIPLQKWIKQRHYFSLICDF